jgi:predicted NAD/FAD-binding protein
VELTLEDGTRETFDHAIFATHADATLKIAQGLDSQERGLLSAFGFSANSVVLHSDPALMPRRRKAWSSWNFLSDGAEADAGRPAQVTYWMNRLQGLPQDLPLFVSLNSARAPRADLVHGTYSYDHPLFTTQAFEAQTRMDHIQGRMRAHGSATAFTRTGCARACGWRTALAHAPLGRAIWGWRARLPPRRPNDGARRGSVGAARRRPAGAGRSDL